MVRRSFLLLLFSLFLFSSVRYKVLIIEGKSSFIGEFQGHIEDALGAAGIKYEVLSSLKRLGAQTLLKGDELRFTSVLIFRRPGEFSPYELNLLKKASREGVSLLSFTDVMVGYPAFQAIFGIKQIGGKFYSETIKIRHAIKPITDDLLNVKLKNDYLRLVDIERSCKVYVSTLDNVPVFFSYRFGKGVNYTFNLSDNSLSWWYTYFRRTKEDARLLLLKRAILENSGYGFVYFDLSKTLILRVDDFLFHRYTWSEGSSEAPVYNWRFSKEDFQHIGNILEKHNAHASFLVIIGFVDPGVSKGKLFINGKPPAVRGCGMVFDAPEVEFEATSGWNAGSYYDYKQEYEGLKDLQNKGDINIEFHGYTHINYRRDLWCSAPNRFTAGYIWEREFKDLYTGNPVPRNVQEQIIETAYSKLTKWFGKEPTSFIPPGHAFDKTTLQLAYDYGFPLFSAGNIYFRGEKGFRPNWYVSVYNTYFGSYGPPSTNLYWHLAVTPVQIYIHDWDIALNGFNWFDEFLTQWEETYNLKRIISLRELVGYYYSAVSAIKSKDSISFQIDIKGTGGRSDKPGDRFFSTHKMRVYLHLPKDWSMSMALRGFFKAKAKIGSNIENLQYDGRNWFFELPEFASKESISGSVELFNSRI